MLILLTFGESIAINQLYLYSPEVFPTSVRVTAFGVCQFGHRFAPVISPFCIAALSEISWSLVCFVLGSVFLLCSILSFFLRTETFNAPLVEEKFVDDEEQDDKGTNASGFFDSLYVNGDHMALH